MNEAVVGLIGAVIGGTLTSGTTLLTEWQRIRAGRREHEAEDFKRYMQAGRLVADEMFEIETTLYYALESRTWWPGQVTLPVERWEAYAPTLALGDDQAWTSVAGSYEIVKDVNLRVAVARAHGDNPLWTQDTPRELEIVRESVRHGENRMRETIGLDPLGPVDDVLTGQLPLRFRDGEVL